MSGTSPASGPSPFARIGIAGLGLIGGSVALATRAAWPDATLVGIDFPEAIARARHRGLIDEAAVDLADVAPLDLIVLAVPLSAIVSLFPAVRHTARGAVVTDVGSTKRRVMSAAAEAGVPCFVGGHPMAGSERGGLDEARADLFARRPWLLVDGGAPREAGERLARFVSGLGGLPRWIDAAAHDRAVAYLSHLPQVIAVSLMNAAADGAGAGAFAARGRAFEEMTRLASSPPDMWRDILADNADYVSEALAAFARLLPGAAELADPSWIQQMFSRADAARSRTGEPPTQGS